MSKPPGVRSDDDAAGRAVNRLELSFRAMRDGKLAGIPPNGQAEFPGKPTEVVPLGDMGTLVKATLDDVIFEDGEVVGPDHTRLYQIAADRVNAERDLATFRRKTR